MIGNGAIQRQIERAEGVAQLGDVELPALAVVVLVEGAEDVVLLQAVLKRLRAAQLGDKRAEVRSADGALAVGVVLFEDGGGVRRVIVEDCGVEAEGVERGLKLARVDHAAGEGGEGRVEASDA